MGPQLEPNTYRVEVSGWDSSENFFVEKTALTWGRGAQKQVSLKSDLREGCVLFVRLLQPTAMVNTVPIAYQAIGVTPKDSDGRTRVLLAQLRPRAPEDAPGLVESSGTRAA